MVALLWTHSFFLGLSCAYFVSASLPLFLSAYTIDDLPLAFIAAALVQLVIGYVMDRLEHSIGLYRLLAGALTLVILASGLFRIILFNHLLWPIFGLFVWTQAVLFIADNAFWGLSSQFFDVRQGKRLFSLIDSGAFFAKILGYFSVPLLLPILSVPDLIWLSIVAMAIAIYMLYRIRRAFPNPHLQSEHQPFHRKRTKGPSTHLSHAHHHEFPKISIQEIVRHKYIISVAATAFLALIAITSINYGFLREIDQKFAQTTQVAYFIGIFFGVAKLISLIVKVGVAGKLFDRFGLARISILLPIALFAITVIGLILNTVSQTAAVMIWAFSANMLLVEMWSETIHMPVMTIALQPLPYRERTIGHRVIDNIVEPVALGMAGALLYLLAVFIGFSLYEISLIMLGILVLWSVAILAFGREYLQALSSALKHRRLQSSDLIWDHATRSLIQSKLESGHRMEMEHALRVIPKTENALFAQVLPLILFSIDEKKRAILAPIALERIEEFRFSKEEKRQVVSLLERLLDDRTTSTNILSRALRALIYLNDEAKIEHFERWFEDEGPEVREGLLSGLIRYRGVEGALIADKYLQPMAHSADSHQRIQAARIIGHAGVSDYYLPLLLLLRDDQAEVRIAAAQAAVQVAHPALIEPLLQQYLLTSQSQELFAAIENALRHIGAPVFPHIIHHIESGAFDHSRLNRLTRLLGAWCISKDTDLREQATRLLLDFLSWPNKHRRVLSNLRLAALHALFESNIHIPESAEIHKTIDDELNRAQLLIGLATLLERSSVVRDNSEIGTIAFVLIRSTIAYEINQSVHRVLLLLSLVYDRQTIVRVRDSFISGSEVHWANAIEALDHLLPTAHSKPVVLLIEASLVLSGKRVESGGIDELVVNAWTEEAPIQQVLSSIISDENKFYEPWSLATIINYAGLNYWSECSRAIADSAQRDDLVGEVSTVFLAVRGQALLQRSEGAPIEQLNKGANVPASLFIKFYEIENHPMFIIFERVFLLKTVDLFRDTPDPVLAHVAQAMEEVHVAPGTRIMEKGELGNCLYIIVQGRVSVKDGDHVLAELGAREVVGELALLDPEPRSASVYALEETTLLKLNWETFYDLMIDNVDLARGAITMLCRRLRNQNGEMIKLQAMLAVGR